LENTDIKNYRQYLSMSLINTHVCRRHLESMISDALCLAAV